MEQPAEPMPEAATTGVAIDEPKDNATVGTTFTVEGTYPTNNTTMIANVYPSGSNISIRTGNGVVMDGKFSIPLNMIPTGTNPHRVSVAPSSQPNNAKSVSVTIS